MPSFFSEHPLFILDHNTLDVLDVNEQAIAFYGYSRDEFCRMNINDLGEKYRRADIVGSTGDRDESADKIWKHQTKAGDVLYVQFTSHEFNYKGGLAKLAVAHDVSRQVETQEKNPNKFPQINFYKGDRALAEITWDADRRVTTWSEKAQDLFGWSEEEVAGKADFFEAFIHEDEFAHAESLIEDAMHSMKASYTVDGRVITKAGDIRVCEWYNTLVYDADDQLVSIYSLVHDISERKESEYLFKALSEESLVGVYLIQDDLFKYINPHFAEIFGYAKDEIEGTLGPLDLTHPADREEVAEKIRSRLDGERKSIKYDFRTLTKEGETVHVKVFGTLIEYLGKPAVVGTLLDITHTKLAFERYQASVESFENLFDSISDAIYIQDKEGKFIKVNEAAAKLNGYERDTLIGSTPARLAAPGKTDLNKTRAYFEKALKGESQKFEQWGMRKSGEVFLEEVVLNPGTYFGEDVVIAISKDISDRYEIENKVQKSEEMFRQLFQNAPFGIVMMDKHQEIREVNPAFENIFAYQTDEIKGLNIDQLIVPAGEDEHAHAISREIYKGQASSAISKRVRKDGSLIDTLIYGVPVIVNNRTIAIFGIYVDITERKEAEEKIKKSLKEKEVLLAEIHHRVKNNLAVVTGLLELQQYNSDSEEAKDVLRESQLRINSIALIHEKLYQNENLSEISIDVYLNDLVQIIISSMSTDETDVSVTIKSEEVYLTINQAIPCALILNELITNAYKHAFKGRKTGEVSISITEKDRILYMSFEDDGLGIPQNLDMENPTTLGLTLINTLSRQLRGTGNFENPEQGMLFTLEFALDN